MIPVKHIDPDDLPLYAMQILPADEAEELSLHLQHSAEARRVLGEIYGDLAILALGADMHSPPALARQRLMKHVAREKKIVPAHLLPVAAPVAADTYAPRTGALLEAEPAPRSFASRVLPWTGWALAAGLAVAAAGLYQQRSALEQNAAGSRSKLAAAEMAADTANAALEAERDPAAVHVVLTGSDLKPPPQGRASYVPEKGSLVFVASNLEPLQPYKTYELWLIPADGHDPIPAGTFKPDARGYASVVMPELPKGVQAKAFGVTIEDGDGAAQPTLPIVLKGAAG